MFEYYADSELIEETSSVYREYTKGGNAAHTMYLSHLYIEIKNRKIESKLNKGINMSLENLISSTNQSNNVKNNFIPDLPDIEVTAEEQTTIEDPKTTTTTMTTTTRKTRAKNSTSLNPLADLQAWIEEVAKSGVDENKVKQIVAEQLSSLPARKIEININNEVTKLSGAMHYYFELVLKVVSCGVNLALSGSTATSKTTMAIQSAKALKRNYYIQPMNDGTTKSDIMGYMSASGEYIKSSFYRAMTEGAIYVAEEIDSGSPACLLVLNNAVDNRECTFPNGETVQAKEGFQVICTMNTKGTGADRKFVGRNRLDAATLDRFCLIDVPIDRSLAASIIGLSIPSEKLKIDKGGIPTMQEWFDLWEAKQASFAQSHPDKIISMRALRDGSKLFQAGIGLNHVINICINK